MDPQAGSFDGGALNQAIANEIGHLLADFTGRGASKSRAFVHDDVVVCLLEHSLTKAEQNLIAAGEAEAVRRLRDVFQTSMETDLVAIVERLTGRRVRAFVSGSNVSTDTSTEVFLLEAAS
jgi:uncharacterized protein YbcI